MIPPAFIIAFAIGLWRFIRSRARRIYQQTYQRHIVFEEEPLSKIRQLLFAVICLFVTFAFLFVSMFHPEYNFDLLIGILVVFGAYFISYDGARLLVYWYANKHPHELSGVVHCKPRLARVMHLAILIPVAVLMIAVAFWTGHPGIICTAAMLCLLTVLQGLGIPIVLL